MHDPRDCRQSAIEQRPVLGCKARVAVGDSHALHVRPNLGNLVQDHQRRVVVSIVRFLSSRLGFNVQDATVANSRLGLGYSLPSFARRQVRLNQYDGRDSGSSAWRNASDWSAARPSSPATSRSRRNRCRPAALAKRPVSGDSGSLFEYCSIGEPILSRYGSAALDEDGSGAAGSALKLRTDASNSAAALRVGLFRIARRARAEAAGPEHSPCSRNPPG